VAGGDWSGSRLVQVLLEADEEVADFFGLTQLELGIGDGMIPERQQGSQLLHVQLLNTNIVLITKPVLRRFGNEGDILVAAKIPDLKESDVSRLLSTDELGFWRL
jgi:hypothetical protein